MSSHDGVRLLRLPNLEAVIDPDECAVLSVLVPSDIWHLRSFDLLQRVKTATRTYIERTQRIALLVTFSPTAF